MARASTSRPQTFAWVDGPLGLDLDSIKLCASRQRPASGGAQQPKPWTTWRRAKISASPRRRRRFWRCGLSSMPSTSRCGALRASRNGPPFATGLPHYGHILAGTIKDIVTRYASQTGHHVSRRFGWDCHGLPVEQETEKLLGLKGRTDILSLGIGKFNEECRAIVMRFANEWEKTVTRLGRWIDFKNDYKTLDPSFMESVCQLYAKGLVYKGLKVMPVSTGCATTLANFEAGQNYKQVDDPAVMVSFPVVGDADGAALVAWTTTPWTLPSNLALCVNADFTYVR
ncbi:uncharacterized protein HaLaN_01657, partial [Haematococcus lacustris]